mgnify:CR=1 FL=1
MDAATLGAWIEACSRTVPDAAMRSSWPRPGARLLPATWRALRAGGRAGGGASPLRRAAAWRRWRRARRSSPPRWRPGRDRSWWRSRPTGARSPIPIAVGAAARRARPAAGRDGAGVHASVRCQPGLGRRAPASRSGQSDGLRVLARARAADPARGGRGGAGLHVSTTSAAPRLRPTSPPCGMRRSIRGSSDREAETP